MADCGFGSVHANKPQKSETAEQAWQQPATSWREILELWRDRASLGGTNHWQKGKICGLIPGWEQTKRTEVLSCDIVDCFLILHATNT